MVQYPALGHATEFRSTWLPAVVRVARQGQLARLPRPTGRLRRDQRPLTARRVCVEAGGGAVARARARHRVQLGVLVAGGRVRVAPAGSARSPATPHQPTASRPAPGCYPSCLCTARRRRSCPRSGTPPISGRRSGRRRSCSRSRAGSARSPATPHQPTASRPSPDDDYRCRCSCRRRRSCPRSVHTTEFRTALWWPAVVFAFAGRVSSLACHAPPADCVATIAWVLPVVSL